MVSRKIWPVYIGLVCLFLGFYFNTFIYNIISVYRIGPRVLKYKLAPQILQYNGSEDYLIDTPGCYIPNYSKKIRYDEAKNMHGSCGSRAVFVNLVNETHFSFRIDQAKMKSYAVNVTCCYQFGSRHNESENKGLTYTPCEQFKNGDQLTILQEIITVKCSQHTNKDKIVYDDAYLVLKKASNANMDEIKSQTNPGWNVLIIAMDTVSRARIYREMPETVRYLQQHNWQDFRGYQKVGYNTFPNVMSLLTGRNVSRIYRSCGKMDACKDIMIWSHFERAGYATAYSEDYLRLPDTFSLQRAFTKRPATHYPRAFFENREKQQGNLICAGKQPSALHLLQYATQFADAYMYENFFGIFWLNSYSHNLDNIPTLIDKDMVEFFTYLDESGVLNNTFVFLMSDHGIRFGKMRESVESFYDERLPMLFAWTPRKFKTSYPEKYINLKLNENRLTTPYDLHLTLWEILSLSNSSVSPVTPEACPQCKSLFEEQSPHRTCQEAGVDMKWCSCNELISVPLSNKEASHSLDLAITDLQNYTKTIQTNNCMICSPLKLKTLLRIHYFRNDNNETHYVVAFIMEPGNVGYEASVVTDGITYNILQPTHTITTYNTRGNCVTKPNNREYCVCIKNKDCNKSKNKSN